MIFSWNAYGWVSSTLSKWVHVLREGTAWKRGLQVCSSGSQAPSGAGCSCASWMRKGPPQTSSSVNAEQLGHLRGRDQVCDTGYVIKSTQHQINHSFLGVVCTRVMYFLNTLISSLNLGIGNVAALVQIFTKHPANARHCVIHWDKTKEQNIHASYFNPHCDTQNKRLNGKKHKRNNFYLKCLHL